MKSKRYIVTLIWLAMMPALLASVYAQTREGEETGTTTTTTTKTTTKTKTTAGTDRHKDGTRIYPDSAIYQGMTIKLDIGNTLLTPATTQWKIQSYEIAMNWRLMHKFFPTLELGYAGGDAAAEGGQWHGQGGFGRIGLDYNPLKKRIESPNALLVGLRLGTAVQGYNLTDVTQTPNGYWTESSQANIDFLHQTGADCWGEILAGCQVQIWEGLQMGWYIRMKILFTRSKKDGGPMAYYIPGFGFRDDTQWGINYYIGYKF